MNHGDLLVVDAESLAVGKTSNSGKLIHKNYVFIGNFLVDSIQVGIEQLVIDWVVPSLLQTHVIYATQNFEEVFYDIILRLIILAHRQEEFVPLLLNHMGGHSSLLSTASLLANHPKISKQIEQVDLFLSPFIPPLIVPESVGVLFVELSELFWVLLLLKNGGVIGHIKHVNGEVARLIVGGVFQHLDRVA